MQGQVVGKMDKKWMNGGWEMMHLFKNHFHFSPLLLRFPLNRKHNNVHNGKHISEQMT